MIAKGLILKKPDLAQILYTNKYVMFFLRISGFYKLIVTNSQYSNLVFSFLIIVDFSSSHDFFLIRIFT